MPKGHPLADWAGSLRVAHFGTLRPSSPRSEQQGACAFRSPLSEWMGEGHPYPFRSKMAKVELYGVLGGSAVGESRMFVLEFSDRS